jgi:hypothetical protein
MHKGINLKVFELLCYDISHTIYFIEQQIGGFGFESYL